LILLQEEQKHGAEIPGHAALRGPATVFRVYLSTGSQQRAWQPTSAVQRSKGGYGHTCVGSHFPLPHDSLLGALSALVIFLLATFLFSAIAVYALFVDTYACSDGFIKVRGRRSKRVLQAVRWDRIQEVVLGWSQGRSFTYVRDTDGTRYIVRGEIWLRAGSELADREFASRSSALLATFHAGQPVAFAQLHVSQWGIAVPKGKDYPARVLPLQEISQVKYDQYRNRRGNRRALLSFTLHSNANIPPVDVVSAVDAALLLLFLQTLSQGQIRCVYAGRTF